MGSVGDAYDNAFCGSFFATLEWVAWFNTQRILEPIGNVPPAEAEARYYAQAGAPALAA